MSRSRPLLLAAGGVAALLVVLAGCGQTAVAVATRGPAATSLPTATPTRVPTPTATLLPQTCDEALNGGPSVAHSGDLLIFIDMITLADPSRKLPDGVPLAPFKVGNDADGQLLATEPAVNPHLQEPPGVYIGQVCNASAGATHVLTGLILRIESFTPYSGQLNEWNVCSGVFKRLSGWQVGGCEGAIGDANCARATFATGAGAGATAAFTPTAATGCADNPLPQTLKPAEAYGFNLGIVAPTAPGIYTLSLGISLDGGAPIYVPVPHQLLLAPVAHEWDGQSCTTPAMQSQIPANDTSAYICPKS